MKESRRWDPVEGGSVLWFVVPKMKGMPIEGLLRLTTKVGEVVVTDSFTIREEE